MVYRLGAKLRFLFHTRISFTDWILLDRGEIYTLAWILPSKSIRNAHHSPLWISLFPIFITVPHTIILSHCFQFIAIHSASSRPLLPLPVSNCCQILIFLDVFVEVDRAGTPFNLKLCLGLHDSTFSSVQFSHSVVPDFLWPHESQHARPPCPSPTPGDYSNSCLSSQWCHPAISSSVIPFSSCPQSLPASGLFPMSQLFSWGGQSTGVSASAWVLPVNTQDWSPLHYCFSNSSRGFSSSFWFLNVCPSFLLILQPLC